MTVPQRIDTPLPEAPPWRERVRVTTDSWYVGAKPWRWFTLRLGPGLSARFAGPGAAAGFVIDLDLGFAFGLHRGERQWGLVPVAGYTWRSPGSEDQVSLGLGLARGVRLDTRQEMLSARAVYDAGLGVWGWRLSALARMAENGFSLELGYQHLPGPGVHELRLSLGVDLGLLAAAVFE